MRLPIISRTLSDKLHDVVRSGKWRPDSAQQAACGLLQRVLDDSVAGAYLHGPVGSGKTAVMNLCMQAADRACRRLHFHELMRHTHTQMVSHKRSPVDIGRSLSSDVGLLCLDEVELIDIADAAIFTRILSGLLDESNACAFIATSNAAPSDLYPNGLNRHEYVPRIVRALSERQVIVHELGGEIDYRMVQAAALAADKPAPSRRAQPRERWFPCPPRGLAEAGCSTPPSVDAAVRAIGGGGEARPHRVALSESRHVDVPCRVGRAGRISFAELCEAPLSTADYLLLASAFDALAVVGVPSLADPTRADEARRFVTFIDVWYVPSRARTHGHHGFLRLCPQRPLRGSAPDPRARAGTTSDARC